MAGEPPRHRTRVLPMVLADALDELAKLNGDRMAINDMQLRLNQRGWGAQSQASVLAMLRRRAWAEVLGSTLVLTAAGRQAISEPQCQPTSKRRVKRRLPPGLF